MRGVASHFYRRVGAPIKVSPAERQGREGCGAAREARSGSSRPPKAASAASTSERLGRDPVNKERNEPEKLPSSGRATVRGTHTKTGFIHKKDGLYS